MKSHFKIFFSVLKSSFKEWWKKDPFKESAVIAYYAIFSLPGLLVVIISLAGFFFGKEAVSGQIAAQISSTMGSETALQIQDIIVKAMVSKNTLFASIFGVITIIVGATGVFVEFQKSLNNIWKVQTDIKKSGISKLLKTRIYSFGLIISIAFILIVSLVISAAITALGNWITNHFSESLLFALQILNSILSLFIISLLFALIFKFIPDAKIKWRHVWIGSIATALLFELGKYGLGFYFGKVDPGSGYGAAGSIILILLWVSYSSMIVFYGAEFTFAYATLEDGNIPPNENAVKQKKNV
jgi:membrane protein